MLQCLLLASTDLHMSHIASGLVNRMGARSPFLLDSITSAALGSTGSENTTVRNSAHTRHATVDTIAADHA
uniref:Uncharacterized protein n=1 Tax=Babesia bovis TaxID=5865 RepID=S6B5N4_BABBO|nr:hypothetical protein [Babesia bovis]